jgi:non-homologous end joining protein Ku
VLTTLRTAEEVRSLNEVARPDLPKPDAAMLQIAEKIVEQRGRRASIQPAAGGDG